MTSVADVATSPDRTRLARVGDAELALVALVAARRWHSARSPILSLTRILVRHRRPHLERHVRRGAAHRGTDRPRRPLRPGRRTQRHDQHRPRRHDGARHDLRRMVGMGVRAVDRAARRHRRRHDRRARDERRHHHVRREPHRRRRGDQPDRSRAQRGSWPASCSSTPRAARSRRRRATRVRSARSPCRSCRAAICSAGRRPTSSAGSRTRVGSWSPTSPAIVKGLTTAVTWDVVLTIARVLRRRLPAVAHADRPPPASRRRAPGGRRLARRVRPPDAVPRHGACRVRSPAWAARCSCCSPTGTRRTRSAGRGFLGLATMIFGNWMPGGTALGAGLFGYAQGITLRTNPADLVSALILAAAICLARVGRSGWRSAGAGRSMGFMSGVHGDHVLGVLRRLRAQQPARRSSRRTSSP